MAYTVRSSERLRKSGAEGETKALLYLMNLRSDSDEIHYFVVDFFNDLTGMDRYAEKLWDVQSKAAKNNSPKAIGEELVTLFKNYVSDLEFATFILFVGGVTSTFRIDDSLMTFGIENVKPSAKEKLIDGLISEAKRKTYIENSVITDANILSFLNRVSFVIDNKTPSDYVREIIKEHPAIIPSDNELIAIFNEIRDKQSEKKNTCVEGVTIQTTDQVLSYCRHLTNSEIKLLALQRIISKNPVEISLPLSFVYLYNTWPPEHQKEMFDECKQSLCRALFNKNAADAFWALFECIYISIIKQPLASVDDIYRSIDPAKRNASPDFDVISLKFFIAVVKDGIQNAN